MKTLSRTVTALMLSIMACVSFGLSLGLPFGPLTSAMALTFKKGEVLGSDGSMKDANGLAGESAVSDPTQFWRKAEAAKTCHMPGLEHYPDKIKIRTIRVDDKTFENVNAPLGLNAGSGCKFDYAADQVPSPMVDAKITSKYGGQDSKRFQPIYEFLNTNIGLNRIKPQGIAQRRLKSFLLDWSSQDALKKNIRFKLMKKFRLDFHVQSLLPTMIIAYSDVSGSMTASERIQVGRWLNRLVEQSQKSSFPSRQDNKSYLRHLTALLWGMVIDHEGLIDQARQGYRNAILDMRPDGTFPKDVSRGGTGLHYQNRSTNVLLTMAGYATLIGEDWIGYEVNGRSVKNAVLWLDRAGRDPTMNKIYAKSCEGGSYDTIDEPNLYHLDVSATGESGISWVPLYTALTGDKPEFLSGKFLESRGYWSNSYGPQACVVAEAAPVEITPFDAENDIIFGEPKRTWDVRFEGIKQAGDNVIGAATIGTIIKQHLPARNFQVHFQVTPEKGTGRFALVKGVSNDGNLDSVGKKFSFAIDKTIAAKIKTGCDVELYQANGSFFPTFDLRDVMQTVDRDRPVTGLSKQALCQITEYGRYGLVDMVNMLSLIARGLRGQVENNIYAEDPRAMELLKGLHVPE